MKRLTKLANKHNTDKGTEFDFSHGYTDFYEPFFLMYEKPTILELGVQFGASTLMFDEFYDGDCEIYCIDILDKPKVFEGKENIHFFNLDLGNEEEVIRFIESLGGIKFDIIIDDASHIWQHQYISLINFMKTLKNNGIFIIEDLHTSYDDRNNNLKDNPLYFLNFFNKNIYFNSEKEYEAIKNSIKDAILYNRYNAKNPYERSITSIITFKEK